jgi:hypothetical protein
MQQYWLIVGSEKNWHVAFASKKRDYKEMEQALGIFKQ